MYRKLIITFCLVMGTAVMAAANDKEPGTANGPGGQETPNASTGSAPPPAGGSADPAKTLRGMSILGNNEAPMSLFIVPWKTSDLGAESSLTRTLDERAVPVDREVFMREVNFHEVSISGKRPK